MGRAEIIKEARAKYDAYDSKEWKKAYYDEISGGFNVYHRRHQFTPAGGGGDAEKTVGIILAKYNGKQVEFLPEGGKKNPDLSFESQTWDIKYINRANENTIREDIKKSRKADNAIFFWDKNDKHQELEMAVFREVGRMAKNGRINMMPDIYYIDENKLLKLLWTKKRD